MKEEIAKTKWCPMVRCNGHETDGTYTPSGNCEAEMGSPEIDRTPAYAKCIASSCMMWVTTDNECEPQAGGLAEPISYPAGHCGLAK